MARHKQRQVSLVSDTGPTQPPLPGGWALAVFDALKALHAGVTLTHDLKLSRGTLANIKAGLAMKQSTYDELEQKLVRLAEAAFPRVAKICGSLPAYVNEFFRLWTFSAEHSPQWVKASGHTPKESAILSRALVRDLALRLCYLESCELKLRQQVFNSEVRDLLEKESSSSIYDSVIQSEMSRRRLTQVGLGLKMRAALHVFDARRFREWTTGQSVPSFPQLTTLCPDTMTVRLLSGIAFFDALLRRLGLGESGLLKELIILARNLLPAHRASLDEFSGPIPLPMGTAGGKLTLRSFDQYVAYGQHLLVHPGFDTLIPEKVLSTALWRSHAYALRFAQMVPLALAYLQVSESDNDDPLEQALRQAEDESADCPFHWMQRVKDGTLRSRTR